VELYNTDKRLLVYNTLLENFLGAKFACLCANVLLDQTGQVMAFQANVSKFQIVLYLDEAHVSLLKFYIFKA
jgi:hypothetical protein